MMNMRRISPVFLVMAVLLAACANPPVEPGGGTSSSPTPTDAGSPRLTIYETMIRHLVDPKGAQPIYVLTDLCGQLLQSEVACPDPLSNAEQQELLQRLHDLDIVFRGNDDPGLPMDELFQEILLGPILEQADGLRVEGGSVCGGLCGSGAVYKLVETESGYKVTGTDEQYGMWIS
jgi:hypothetical protein